MLNSAARFTRLLASITGALAIASATVGCSKSAADDGANRPVAASATKVSASGGAETVSSAPSDWPCWRGSNGDAISTETDWTWKWPADGPKKLWTAPVGIGFSAISIADGRAYTMGHKPNEPDDERQEKYTDDTVWCFDAANGQIIWKQSYPCKLVANMHEGGPAATPAIADGRVFTLAKEGHVYCFDAIKGDILWKTELKKLLDVEMPPWGFSCSPRVFGDKVIIDAGPTVALNVKSGEVVWKSKDFVAGYGSPTFFTIGGEPLVAVLNNQYLIVLRLKDGSLVDKAVWTSPYATSSTSPVVETTDKGATIFISTGYNTGCALFDLADGKLIQRYKNKNMRNHMATCVAWKGLLFGFDGNTPPSSAVRFVALKRDSGELLWKYPERKEGDDEPGLGAGTVMRAGDKLIALADDGRLVVGEASEAGFKQLASAEVLKGKCWTTPVLSHGRVYCRNAAGDVVCLDVRK